MFYGNIEQLCAKNGISITALLYQLKISKGNISNWKKGGIPKSDTVQKIAAYFGVSTDYLLTGKESDNDHPENDVTFDDFTYAMYNESKELSEINKRALLDMARIMREREIKEGKRKADK